MNKAAAGLVMAASAISGCGSGRAEPAGPEVQRSYQVGNFERIEVAGPYEVEVTTGSDPSVQARGPERGIDRLIVEVRGNELRIHPRQRSGFNFGWSNRHTVRLTVTVPSLSDATIAGSGTISVNRIQGESFTGQIAGSGDLRLDQVEVGELRFGVAGSGEATARSGRANRVRFEIAGSGDIDAKGVEAENAEVSIAGSGNVRGHASGTADVSIAGSGDVEITGGARCQVSKHGSGDVRCS